MYAKQDSFMSIEKLTSWVLLVLNNGRLLEQLLYKGWSKKLGLSISFFFIFYETAGIKFDHEK